MSADRPSCLCLAALFLVWMDTGLPPLLNEPFSTIGQQWVEFLFSFGGGLKCAVAALWFSVAK